MRKILYSGIFDLLHMGHVQAFKKAKKPGEYLIVHIAGDRETKCVKGALRPIIPVQERAAIIAELMCVDEVIWSEHYLSIEDLIRITKCDVVIRNKGSKEKFSVKTRPLPRSVPKSGLDTTGIIKKIQSGKDQTFLSGINYILMVGNEILLQKRDNKKGIRCPGMLAIPGGALEIGENPHEAAQREIEEETGLDIPLDDFQFVTDFTYPWGQTNRFYLIVLPTKPEIVETEGKMLWKKLNTIKKLAGGQQKILHGI